MSKGFKVALWVILGLAIVGVGIYVYLFNFGGLKTSADVAVFPSATTSPVPPFSQQIAPSVQTKYATRITVSSAVLNEYVVDQGTMPVIDRGFWIGTGNYCSGTPLAVIGSAPAKPVIGPFSYSYTVNNLLPGTTYFYKAYAGSDFGPITYGACDTFVTLKSGSPLPSK